MTTSVAADNANRGVRKVSIERILIPLDGSGMAAGILPVAGDLARRLNARIDLLAVVDPYSTELPSYLQFRKISATGPKFVEAVRLERVRAANEYLISVANSLRKDDLEVDTETMVGDPARKIVAKAKLNHTDLIAMATHGRSAIGRGLLGSVTDKVAHSSAIPMLIVRPTGSGPVEPISSLIVGLDGSKVAEVSIEPARYLAASLGIPTLLLRATASAARVAAYGGDQYLAPATPYSDTDAKAQEYLDTVAAGKMSLDVAVETRVGPGTAYNEIRSAAAEQPGALIILATRGRSGLTRWVLGSVTDRIIRSSDNPVLVIPPSIGGYSEPVGSADKTPVE